MHVLRELLHLVGEIHISKKLLGKLAQLITLFWGHRIEHLLSSSHLLSKIFEKLIERLWIIRKEVSVILHELFEAGILAAIALLDHLVECSHHFFHPLHVFRSHVAH